MARYKADISDGFQRIIDKALDKEPGTRYQHIDELLSDLRRENIDGTNSQKSGSRSKRSLKKISVLFLCIALVTAAGIYLFNVPSKKITFPIHKQLTYEGNVYERTDGSISASSISPDGQFIAYVSEKGDKKSIFIKDIVGGQSFEIIKGIRRIFTLRWSPQSKSLLIDVELNDTTYSCFIVPKFGGNVQPINDNYGILCWSPDEAIIAGTQGFSKTISFIKRETNEIVNSISLTGDFESDK